MKPIKLKIKTQNQKYSIIIGSNLSANVSKVLKTNSISFKQCLLIIDKNVPKQFISKIKKSLNKKIRDLVLKNSISFWLNWKPNILIKRIKYSKKRPLAFNATDNQLIDLIKKRNNIYSKALYEIKCDNLSKSKVVDKILKIYETY